MWATATSQIAAIPLSLWLNLISNLPLPLLDKIAARYRYCCSVWRTILDTELYATCPGERVLAAIRFNVIFLHLKHQNENAWTFSSKDAESLTTHGCVIWCSQIVCIRHCSLKHYNRILLCELQCLFDWWRVMSQRLISACADRIGYITNFCSMI